MIVEVGSGSSALGDTGGYWKILDCNNIAALVAEPEVSVIGCEIFQILCTALGGATRCHGSPALSEISLLLVKKMEQKKPHEHHDTAFITRIPSSR